MFGRMSDPSARQRRFYIASTALIAAISGFLFGYDGSILGAAALYLRDYFHLTPETMGFVFGGGALGYVAGPLVGGWFCDRIGRERTMILGAYILGLGALMTSVAGSLAVFAVFRIICGFAVGISSIAAPMYIAEVAPPRIRGKLGLTFQLAIVVGSAAAPLVAYPMSLHLSPHTSWRWMFATQLVILVPLILFLYQLLPSPRWLAEKGRFDEALAVLRKVHEPGLAENELKEIRAAVGEEQGGWRELLQPGVRFALIIGLLLAFFNNWTGWSAMGGYITNLVELSGVHSYSTAILQFAFTYVAMSLMTVVSMWLVDKVGRRPLWIFASILMAMVTAATGLVFYFHLHGWIVLLVLCLCTVPHGIALGGLPWLMMSELFPNRVRAKAVTVTTMFLFFVIFTCGQLFPIFLDYSNRRMGSAAGVFWLFTFVCFLSTVFGCTIMPETKGRTLEDIAGSLSGVRGSPGPGRPAPAGSRTP
jgi:SP family arabinose:H+ symporter-like MFS transporter